MAFSCDDIKPFLRCARTNGTIDVLDIFEKCPIPDIPIIEKAKQDENLAAFLSFSPVYRWEIHEYNDHYEVRFIDLRYRSKIIIRLWQSSNSIST